MNNMFKYIFTTIFTTFMISNASAQDKIETQKPKIGTGIDTSIAFQNKLFNQDKIKFGIVAGVTYANIYGKEIDYIFADSKTTWQPSLHIGIEVNSMIGAHLSIKNELILNQREAGVTLVDTFTGNKYTSKLKTLYLELYPFSLAYSYKNLQIYAGPYVSALVNAGIKRKDVNGNSYTDKTIYETPSNDETVQKYLQKIDYGLASGVSYDLPFGFFISAKYTYGFADIFQFANSFSLGDPKTDKINIYNKAILISIGYTLSKNKKGIDF